ncbi:hypothetical protein JTE90_029181 [Oedothorax gibbosus]|uniref:Uncharacterized protein n=1 Tax=Oedothorax gibbosus TaxID=931172 RepID=A0AAV6VE53_9ARAC|nr:hypothetical protein JTE90_029181 [Oedothorax gibbosus]
MSTYESSFKNDIDSVAAEEESEVRSTQSDPAIAASENVHDANLCAMRRSMSCMTLVNQPSKCFFKENANQNE